MKTLKTLLFSTLILLFLSFPQEVFAQDAIDTWVEKLESMFDAADYEGILAAEKSVKQFYTNQENEGVLDLLYFMAESHLAMGNFDQGISLMEKEKSLREVAFSEDQEMYAILLDNLGKAYLDNGQFKQALATLELSNKQMSKLFGANNADVVINTIGLANAYVIAGEPNDAIKTLQKLKNNETLQASSELTYYYKKTFADAHKSRGAISKAESMFVDLLAYTEEKFGKESPEFIESVFLLSQLKNQRGDYGNAETLFRSGIASIEKAGVLENFMQVFEYQLAQVYFRIGLYEESLEIMKTISEDDFDFFMDKVNYHSLVGNIQFELGNTSVAHEHFDTALAMLEKQSGKNSLEYIAIMSTKADKYNKSQSYAQAQKLLEEGLKLMEKNFGKNHPYHSYLTYNLATSYFGSGDTKNANKYYSQSLKTRESLYGKQHPTYGETSRKLAELSWSTADWKKADVYYTATFDNLFGQIDNYFPGLSEQEKVNFYNNKVKPAFEAYNSYVIANLSKRPELSAQMYNHQLATKALIMYSTNQVRQRILNSGEDELIEKFENWLSNKELISQLYAMSKEEQAAQPYDIDSLIVHSNELEKELSRLSADFAEADSQKKASWEDVKAKLKSGEAAVEIIRFKAYDPAKSGAFKDQIYYAALIVKADSEYPEIVLMDNGLDMENKFIKNYRNSIKFKINDRYSYSIFWEPIKTKLENIETVYFSPDGIYNQLNLNSFYNPRSKNFLVDEIQVKQLTNTKDLLVDRNLKSNIKTGDARLFGFPNYDRGLEKKEEDNSNLAAKVASNVSLDRGLRGSLQRFISANSLLLLLPGTKQEVELIERMYAENSNIKTTTMIGDDAVESAIKQVKSPQVLHIATHGFFMEDSDDLEDADKYAQNPLLKSGLIMAGANAYLSLGYSEAGSEDGILTAYEAMNLNLDNTELVVLSACETGLGDIKNGEGVYGLQRAFLVAGAETIIMSLWSVDDQATQELMTHFYENWLQSGDKQEAFRKAQIILKEKYKSPFYWGAFVMVGL